jgi:hypothetical protein
VTRPVAEISSVLSVHTNTLGRLIRSRVYSGGSRPRASVPAKVPRFDPRLGRRKPALHSLEPRRVCRHEADLEQPFRPAGAQPPPTSVRLCLRGARQVIASSPGPISSRTPCEQTQQKRCQEGICADSTTCPVIRVVRAPRRARARARRPGIYPDQNPASLGSRPWLPPVAVGALPAV